MTVAVVSAGRKVTEWAVPPLEMGPDTSTEAPAWAPMRESVAAIVMPPVHWLTPDLALRAPLKKLAPPAPEMVSASPVMVTPPSSSRRPVLATTVPASVLPRALAF